MYVNKALIKCFVLNKQYKSIGNKIKLKVVIFAFNLIVSYL